MKKRDYFLLAIQKELFRLKKWNIEIFSQIRNTGSGDPEYDYQLFPGESNYYFIDPESDEPVMLEDAETGRPAFQFPEGVQLNPGDLPNVHEKKETTYGSVLANAILLVYPFGDKIDYVSGEFDLGAVEEEIGRRLTTDEKYWEKGDRTHENPIYVSEYLNFIDAALSLEGFSQLSVPSATPKSLTTDPQIRKRRDELLKQYEGQLDDPAVVAKIEGELIEMDRNWIKGDLSEGFYHKSKSFDVVRKKMHLMHGYESGFDQDPDLIPNSLSEGWNSEKMPAMVNSLREGSFARGSMTELGGYATKIVNRMLQNSKVGEEDCGSTLGVEHRITEDNHKSFIGFFLAESKPRLITESNVKGLIGKTKRIRSPMYCKTKKTDFCQTCVGLPNSEEEKGIPALVAEVTSQLMDASMQKAHGKALKTAKYDPKQSIH